MWKRVDTLVGEDAENFASAAIDAIQEIASDKEASEVFYQQKLPEGMTAEELGESVLRKCLPLLYKRHMDSLNILFAANAGITPEEYKAQTNLFSLSRDIADAISDPLFRSFFGFVQSRPK